MAVGTGIPRIPKAGLPSAIEGQAPADRGRASGFRPTPGAHAQPGDMARELSKKMEVPQHCLLLRNTSKGGQPTTAVKDLPHRR